MLNRPVAAFLAIVLCLLSACTGQVTESLSPSGEGIVTADGFTLSIGAFTVSGPAGVAPEGTRVLFEEIPLPEELSDFGPGSPVFDIALENGQQPTAPVTVTWQVSAEISTDALAFITSPGPDRPWTGVPVTISGREARVELEHFSWGWFTDGTGILQTFTDGILGFLGQRFDPPEGCVQKASLAGTEYALINSAPEFAHGCLAAENGALILTAASNSPYVIPLETANGATLLGVRGQLSWASLLTQLVFHRSGPGREKEGVLLPGGTARFRWEPAYSDGTEVDLVGGGIDPVLGYVAIAATGTDMALAMTIGETPSDPEDLVGLVECIVALTETQSLGSATDVGVVAPGLMGCFAEAADQLFPKDKIGRLAAAKVNVTVAILGSLSGHLTTQLRGVYDAARGKRLVLSVSGRATHPAWVPCDQPDWAVEGRDAQGTLIVASCAGRVGTYVGGKGIDAVRVEEKYSYGMHGISADGTRRLTIGDARTEQVITFMATGRNSTVTRQLWVTRRFPDASCDVTTTMRAALRAASIGFADDPTLTALCVDQWARLTSAEPGDTTMILRPQGNGWQFYTGFPTNLCRSQFLADEGPQAFSSGFRDC